MNSNSGIPHIIIGSVLFIMGGYLAWSFYGYDMGVISETLWGSVIMFAVISLLGLLVLIYGIMKEKKL